MRWDKAVREIRYLENLKQEAFAAELGVSQAAVSQWERGVVPPPQHLQAALMERLNRSPGARFISALRRSVRACPNVAGLFELREGRIWLDTLSTASPEHNWVITETDVGTDIEGKAGAIVDAHYQQLKSLGMFDGNLICGTANMLAERKHRRLFGRVTYSAYVGPDDKGFVRADVLLSDRYADRGSRRDYETVSIVPA